jgi:hypothetical protein
VESQKDNSGFWTKSLTESSSTIIIITFPDVVEMLLNICGLAVSHVELGVSAVGVSSSVIILNSCRFASDSGDMVSFSSSASGSDWELRPPELAND